MRFRYATSALAGRVGLEPTCNWLTASPPTNGAPTNTLGGRKKTRDGCGPIAAPILQRIEVLSTSMSCMKRFQVVKDRHLQRLADDPGTKNPGTLFSAFRGS